MKRPHLLAASQPPPAYAPLVAAARRASLRIGWLELAAALPSLPPALEQAAAAGALRAVAAGGELTVSVKPLRGPAVLDDLLREHFLGCRLVLVTGDDTLPGLEPDAGGWRLTPPGGPPRTFTTDQLLAALRRPGLPGVG